MVTKCAVNRNTTLASSNKGNQANKDLLVLLMIAPTPRPRNELINIKLA
jgi:hypothetical protein